MTTHATHPIHASHEKKEDKAAVTAAEAEATPEPEPPPDPFKIGDEVLAVYPGSPVMTITNISGNALDVNCSWFGTDGAFYERPFHVAALKRPATLKKGK